MTHFQNSLGLYLSKSGNLAAKSDAAALQVHRYSLNAVAASWELLPCFLAAVLKANLLALHSSVNQGAICLVMQLGLVGLVIVVLVTTPAATASFSKKPSRVGTRSAILSATLPIHY